MHLTRYNGQLTFALLALLAAGGAAGVEREEKQRAEIVGEVVIQYGKHVNIPGYAGRTVPKIDFPVYIFEWNQSAAIRDWFQKLERDKRTAAEDPGDSDKQWIVEKRLQDAYYMVIASRQVPERSNLQRAKTDENGRFVFKDLEPGSKYLVIATDDVYELGIILLYETVGPLKPGTNEIRLVEKIG